MNEFKFSDKLKVVADSEPNQGVCIFGYKKKGKFDHFREGGSFFCEEGKPFWDAECTEKYAVFPVGNVLDVVDMTGDDIAEIPNPIHVIHGPVNREWISDLLPHEHKVRSMLANVGFAWVRAEAADGAIIWIKTSRGDVDDTIRLADQISERGAVRIQASYVRFFRKG